MVQRRTRDLLNRIDKRLNIHHAGCLRYLDQQLASQLDRTLQITHSMTANQTIVPADLPASVRARMISEEDTWLVMVKANGDIWDEAFLQGYLRELGSIHDEMAGLAPLWHRMLTRLIDDLQPILIALTLVVIVLVFVDLRSVRSTLLALAPLVLGLVWTMGVLSWMGVPFNFTSILCVPLLVGIARMDLRKCVLERSPA